MPSKYWDNSNDCERANKWKTRGLNHTNDEIKDILKIFHECKHCKNCDKLLTYNNDSSQKCMDHDHKTGKFRQVLCRGCNIHFDREPDRKPRKRMTDEQRLINRKNTGRKYDMKRRETTERKEYTNNYNKEYKIKNQEKLNEYAKYKHKYISSWGGDPRSNCNLLKISLELFF